MTSPIFEPILQFPSSCLGQGTLQIHQPLHQLAPAPRIPTPKCGHQLRWMHAPFQRNDRCDDSYHPEEHSIPQVTAGTTSPGSGAHLSSNWYLVFQDVPRKDIPALMSHPFTLCLFCTTRALPCSILSGGYQSFHDYPCS